MTVGNHLKTFTEFYAKTKYSFIFTPFALYRDLCSSYTLKIRQSKKVVAQLEQQEYTEVSLVNFVLQSAGISSINRQRMDN